MGDDQSQQTPATALRPMRTGELLGAALRLYRERWRTFLGIMAIAAPVAVSFPSTKVSPDPGDLYQVVMYHRVVATGASWRDTAVVLLAELAGLLGFVVVVGALIRAAVVAVASGDLGVRRSYRFGVGRLWPLLRALLLIWLFTTLGLIVLVIPGIFIGVTLAAAVPALVVEGLGARQALARSSTLVGGQWWHTFGTLLLTWLVLGLAVALVDGAAGALGGGWVGETLAQALSIALAAPFAALVAVLLYLDLRARKEPLDTDRLRDDLRSSEL